MPGIAAPMLPRDDLTLAHYDLSDRGNAERFIVRCGDRFRYVRNHGWFAFVGTHWENEGAEAMALKAAMKTAEAIGGEAKACYEAAERDIARAKLLMERAKAVQRWATTSGGVPRLNGMLTAAAAKLESVLADFDTDPLALNVTNGTLRFLKDEHGRYQAALSEHDARDRISRIAAFPYDPSASAPLWLEHLAKVMPDIWERRFLQRMIGYAALGVRKEQCFFMWQGKGGDGKSVTAGVMRRVLGSYVFSADVKTFLEDKQGRSAAAASPDLARLAGATRIVSTAEPPRGSRLNEGMLKQATGGAPMTARHLNQAPFEFLPRFALFLECNARPGISGSDDGIWRRIHLLPWRVQIKAEEMDRGLEDRIVRAEGAGVLAWIVEGALNYLDRGLDPPSTVRAANSEYRRGSNAFREWLDTYCEAAPDAVETFAALYASYKECMTDQGAEDRQIMSAKAFAMALGDHQITETRAGHRGDRARRGVRLRTLTEVSAMRQQEADMSAQSLPPADPAAEWMGDD